MESFAVVEDFDVVGDGEAGADPGGERFAVIHLGGGSDESDQLSWAFLIGEYDQQFVDFCNSKGMRIRQSFTDPFTGNQLGSEHMMAARAATADAASAPHTRPAQAYWPDSNPGPVARQARRCVTPNPQGRRKFRIQKGNTPMRRALMYPDHRGRRDRHDSRQRTPLRFPTQPGRAGLHPARGWLVGLAATDVQPDNTIGRPDLPLLPLLVQPDSIVKR